MGDSFRTIVEVRQGWLLSPTIFNIFLERITTDASEDYKDTANIGSRITANLRFAHNIDCLEGVKLDESLDKASTPYDMESSAGKTSLMTNTTSGIKTVIKINRSLRQSQASSILAQL